MVLTYLISKNKGNFNAKYKNFKQQSGLPRSLLLLAIVEVQSFGDGKGLTIRMSERVIIRKEFFNITLEERDVSYKVIIQDIREQYD